MARHEADQAKKPRRPSEDEGQKAPGPRDGSGGDHHALKTYGGRAGAGMGNALR
jgi:hypothetical protein